MAVSDRLRSVRRAEWIIEMAIRVCGWSAIVVVFAILFFVFREAAPLFAGAIDLGDLFTSADWRPESAVHPRFGLLALLAGTVSVTVVAMAIALPAGVAAAVYVSEFCRPAVREVLKVVIELLAAIPSIVWGFIGYMVINPIVMRVTGAPIGINVLTGALVLAFMSVPIIMSMGEDALKAVPDAFREAALALGASRWQVVWRVLLPAAKNGLLGAALLGAGRAIGETMAVLMATGHSVRVPHSVLDPVRTLTATIAAELGEAVSGGTHYRLLFLIGSLLMLVSLAVNITADLIVRGVRQAHR